MPLTWSQLTYNESGTDNASKRTNYCKDETPLVVKTIEKHSKVIRKPGQNFMNSDTALRLLPLLLEEMEDAQRCQEAVNESCQKVAKLILNEASASVEGNKKKRQHT